MSSKPGPKGIDHDAERERYRTGDETFEDVAARLGVNVKTVENMAARKHPKNAGESWGEMRVTWRAETAAESSRRAGDRVADVLARVREKSARVAERALQILEDRLNQGVKVHLKDGTPIMVPIETKDVVAAAKLGTAVKIELAGSPDGVAVKVQHDLHEMSDDELLALAGSAAGDA